MTEQPNLYSVGFEDGFNEAQRQIKELDARINELEADNGYFRQAARYASDWEAAADKLKKEVVAENKQLRQKLNEVIAHLQETVMSDATKKAIIARLRDFPTDLNVQAADIIEELMAERDKLQRELRRLGVEKFDG